MHSIQIHRPFTTLTRHRRHRLHHDIQLEIAVRRMDFHR